MAGDGINSFFRGGGMPQNGVVKIYVGAGSLVHYGWVLFIWNLRVAPPYKRSLTG